MYLEFRLPSGAGGMAAGYTSHAISKRIDVWCNRHNYTCEKKYGPYRLWVIFDEPQAYTLFGVSWQHWNIYSVPEIIDKPFEM